MNISKIQIENYKSIKKCFLSLKDINVLIGENGSGKTNVISAIKYFYDNLLIQHNDENIFDINNKFSNCTKISITYNLHDIQMKCKNQISINKSPYIPYFQRIVNIGKNHQITLTLIKIKDKKIIWKGCSIKERALLHDLMPLYFIDSRSLNLTDWDILWQHIGDLVKTDNETSKQIKNDINNIISNDDYKLKASYDKLEKSFENSNVKIEKFSPKQYARALTQTYFQGHEFDFKKNKLFHFSNGTNSFNYTKLLIEILSLISEKKMKSPLIVIDEPEISLHHKLIDELSEHIFETSNNIEFILSTHSPRVIKNIMMGDSKNSCVFHVRNIKHYSFISSMKLFDNKKEFKPKIRITDQHANAYFSQLLFSIEGATELELFQNKFLQELFPILKEADIIDKAMSDDVDKNIISPKIRKYSTPMIALTDMDKAIRCDPQKNSFIIKERFFQSYNNNIEQYYYTEKRSKTYTTRKRIYAMSLKCKFNYLLPFYSSEDINYGTFLKLIKNYFKEYGLIIAQTTSEGLLINKDNISEFWDFAQKYIFSNKDLNNISLYYNSFDSNNKLNFLRLLFNGKSDYILNLDEIEEVNKGIDKDLCSVIKNNRMDKTCGWVSKWIEYFLCSTLNINYNKDDKDDKDNRFKDFKMAIEDKSTLQNVQNKFIKKFQEINEVISAMVEVTKN